MRRRLIFSPIVAFVLSAVSACATPQPDSLQSEYLAIYIKMNEAAKLQVNGDDRGSLVGFEDCYKRLDSIHNNNPKWENALVLSRMGDCKAQIVDLETKLNVRTKPAPAVATAAIPVAGPQSAKVRLAALEAAVKTTPNSAAAIFNLGTAYYQVGQTEVAIDKLQRGLAIEPNNGFAHNFLGLAFMRKGRIDSAAKEFQKSILIDEGFADAHYNLAILYATEDPPALKSASTQYRRALELGIAPDPHLEKVMRTASR